MGCFDKVISNDSFSAQVWIVLLTSQLHFLFAMFVINKHRFSSNVIMEKEASTYYINYTLSLFG